MSGPLIIVTGIIYVYVAIEQALKGNSGMCIAYAGYAFANYGWWKMAP